MTYPKQRPFWSENFFFHWRAYNVTPTFRASLQYDCIPKWCHVKIYNRGRFLPFFRHGYAIKENLFRIIDLLWRLNRNFSAMSVNLRIRVLWIIAEVVPIDIDYVVLLVPSFWPFSTWVIPVFLPEYCRITLRIMCLLFELSFDVLSVICRLHNLRSPFKIHFYLVPRIVFSFRAHAFFN
jgi:hypothetical protein